MAMPMTPKLSMLSYERGTSGLGAWVGMLPRLVTPRDGLMAKPLSAVVFW